MRRVDKIFHKNSFNFVFYKLIQRIKFITAFVINILWNKEEFRKRAEQKHHLLMDIIRKPFLMIIGDEDEFRRAIEK